MVPTTIWLKDTFNFYNKKYFNGRLKTPIFSLNCPSEYWGEYSPDVRYDLLTRKIYRIYSNGLIKINTTYDRNERDVINTLLHEMIHMYINTVDCVYPICPHGRLFKKWANKLNHDGWEIYEITEIKPTDIKI